MTTPIKPTSAVTKKEDKENKELEFIPFGSTENIRLSIAIVRSLLCEPTKSGAMCSERDAMKFMMMCKAKGLNPFEQDAFLVGYDTQNGPKFSQITAHQAFLKRAELHPEYDGMQSGVIVQNEDGTVAELEGDFYMDDQKLLGGWAKVYFKNRKIPIVRRVRLSTFRTNTHIWNQNPAGMIVKTSEIDALRSSFPTKLGGLYMAEELSFVNAGAVPLAPPGPSFLGPADTLSLPAPVVVPIPTTVTPSGEPVPADDNIPMDFQEPTKQEAPPPTPDAARAASAEKLKSSTVSQLQELLTSSGVNPKKLVNWMVEKGMIAPEADTWEEGKTSDLVKIIGQWKTVGQQVAGMLI